MLPELIQYFGLSGTPKPTPTPHPQAIELLQLENEQLKKNIEALKYTMRYMMREAEATEIKLKQMDQAMRY